MPPIVTFQGSELLCLSIDDFGVALNDFDKESQFELWLKMPGGASICMLRNGRNAWLMYLRHEGDSGFNSVGNSSLVGLAAYKLSNGQVDEYPLDWCIEVERCYKAIVYFFVNEGAKPEWVQWQES